MLAKVNVKSVLQGPSKKVEELTQSSGSCLWQEPQITILVGSYLEKATERLPNRNESFFI